MNPHGSGPVSPPGDDDPGEDELLIDGQEEVFSRKEMLTGRIEHHFGEETLPERGVVAAPHRSRSGDETAGRGRKPALGE